MTISLFYLRDCGIRTVIAIMIATLCGDVFSVALSRESPSNEILRISSVMCFFEGPRFLDKSISGSSREAVCVSTMANCLQAFSLLSSDGLFAVTRCWNQYAYLQKSVGNTGYPFVSETEARENYFQIKSNENFPFTCFERVWILDRKSSDLALRACSLQ